jgi:16S rRNA (guanine966-N2)-methyltransferase
MRVITGKAKGRHLKFPKGTKTRPVTDLVRGAIFAILENIASDWAQVLDLFAGSGALGIEALSRGAGWVDFVENERRCCDIIKENLAATEFSARGRVFCCSVDKALSLLDKEYDIILMDPPYANPTTGEILTRLSMSTLVGAKTTLVVTHSARLPLNKTYGALNLTKETRHGDSCISIFQKEVRA